MNFDVAAVESHLRGRVRRCGHGREDVLPDATHAPAREAIVDRLVRSILGRAIDPTAPHLLHMHDPAQNPPIIKALRTTLVGRQMRLDLRPLFIAEPKQISAHRSGLPNRLTKPLNQHMVN